MLRNYLKVALRNITKNKLFSLINIAGMTLGMASFFVISIFVWDELKYDSYHPDKDRTFRIYNTSIDDVYGGTQRYFRQTVKPTYGIDFDFTDFGDLDAVKAKIKNLIDAYINQFGDRCTGELKLETITYRQEPTAFIQIIKSYVQQDIQAKTRTASPKSKIEETLWDFYSAGF